MGLKSQSIRVLHLGGHLWLSELQLGLLRIVESKNGRRITKRVLDLNLDLSLNPGIEASLRFKLGLQPNPRLILKQ